MFDVLKTEQLRSYLLMMFICESLMVKIWHFAFPEPVVFLSIARCTPSFVLTRRWPLPCIVVSAIDLRSIKRPNLLSVRYFQIHAGFATTFCPKEPAYPIPHVDASDALVVTLFGELFTVTLTLVMSRLR